MSVIEDEIRSEVLNWKQNKSLRGAQPEIKHGVCEKKKEKKDKAESSSSSCSSSQQSDGHKANKFAEKQSKKEKKRAEKEHRTRGLC